MPQAIALVDRECRALRVNREFVRIFGYSEQEIAGSTISSLIVPPEFRDEAEFLRLRGLAERPSAPKPCG